MGVDITEYNSIALITYFVMGASSWLLPMVWDRSCTVLLIYLRCMPVERTL
jgi:hypothetical protein